MQSPIIVFDHINKTVITIPTGPAGDKKLGELLATAQGSQASTSSSGSPER